MCGDIKALTTRYQRLERIIKYIQEINPDIICLQEVFMLVTPFNTVGLQLVIRLQDALSALGYSVFIPAVAYGQNGGCVFASRITDFYVSTFIQFDNYSFVERLNNKGFIVSKSVLYTIINLHLNSHYPEIRKKQICQINRYIIENQLKNIIIVGDWNVSSQQEWNSLRDLLQDPICSYTTTCGKPTHIDGNAYDHIVSEFKFTHIIMHETTPMSDHFSLIAKLNMN